MEVFGRHAAHNTCYSDTGFVGGKATSGLVFLKNHGLESSG